MKQLLCLALLLVCALPCAAQKATGPFVDVPLNTWPFAAADTIQKAGIVFGYPDGTYGGRRAMTRYEFAVATERLLAQMPEPPAVAPTDMVGRLRQSPLAINAVMALVEEFSPELSKIGQNVPQATAILAAMQAQARQDIRDGKIILTAEQLRNPFADVPRTAAAPRFADALTKAGIVGVGMPPVSDWPASTFSGSLPVTRLQMAQSLQRLVFNKDAAGDIAKRLRQSPNAIPALRALSTEFAPELKLLESDPAVHQARLDGLIGRQPLPLTDHYFTDVPPAHWAWQAVETLRQNGIVAGYPNGAYTTQ